MMEVTNNIDSRMLSCIDRSLSISLLSLTFSCLDSDLFVILLEGSKILSGFRELTLFHTLSHVPVHKCSLCIHQIELMVQS